MTFPVPLQRRTRALLLLAIFLAYYAGTEIFARRITLTLVPAEWFSVAYQALRLLLALAGVLVLERFFLATGDWEGAQLPQLGGAAGWQPSPGSVLFFAEGAALGWGIVLALVLPIVLDGGLHAFFDLSAGAWARFALVLLATACGSALRQTVLAGLPFRWLMAASSPAFAVVLMAFFAALTLAASQSGRAGWSALLTIALFQALCCLAALRIGGLWLGVALDFSARIAMGGIFGFPVLGSSLYSSPVLANSAAPDWLTGAAFGPAGSFLAPIIVALAIWVLLRMIPVDVIGNIRPGGVPVTFEARHAKGFEDPAPAAPSLVQIAPSPLSAPLSSDDSEPR